VQSRLDRQAGVSQPPVPVLQTVPGQFVEHMNPASANVQTPQVLSVPYVAVPQIGLAAGQSLSITHSKIQAPVAALQIVPGQFVEQTNPGSARVHAPQVLSVPYVAVPQIGLAAGHSLSIAHSKTQLPVAALQTVPGQFVEHMNPASARVHAPQVLRVPYVAVPQIGLAAGQSLSITHSKSHAPDAPLQIVPGQFVEHMNPGSAKVQGPQVLKVP